MADSPDVIRSYEDDVDTFDGDSLSKADSNDTQTHSGCSQQNLPSSYHDHGPSYYDITQRPFQAPFMPQADPVPNYYNYPYEDYSYSPYEGAVSSLPYQADPNASYQYQYPGTYRPPVDPYLNINAPPPAPPRPMHQHQQSTAAPTIMCCYHKRGVCKKGSDCWYSHEGKENTPCHYGVKCVAGHANLSRTALSTASGTKAPSWGRQQIPSIKTAKKNTSKGKETDLSSQSLPKRKKDIASGDNGDVAPPPSVDGEECKFCGHSKLYVMPYRLYSGHGPSTLQYRIHCMNCHGSWTPT